MLCPNRKSGAGYASAESTGYRRPPPAGAMTLQKIVIAITGATGSIYGLRLLEMLSEDPSCETHLVISQAAALNIRAELPLTLKKSEASADVVPTIRNVGASISSGSFICAPSIIATLSLLNIAAIPKC